MTRKRTAKLQAKNVGKAPVWLKTVAIAKPVGRAPVRGSFGAASPVVLIDPMTGLPKTENRTLGGDEGEAGVNP